MIQKLLLATLFSLLSFSGYSQNNLPFGIKAGVNTAGIYYPDGKISYTSNYSPNVGFISDFSLTNKLYIQGEMLYNRKFAPLFPPVGVGSYMITSKLDYIDVPVVAKYNLFKNFAIEAGPQLGILLRKKHFLVTHPNNIEQIQEIEVNNVNNLELSGVIGLQYKFTNSLFAQFRYSHGLTDVYKNYWAKVKNSIIGLSLGYLFH